MSGNTAHGGPGHPAEGPDAGGSDPSMEDILASIRRILNEDEQPAAAAAPDAPPPAAAEHEGVLMLNEAMLVPASVETASQPVPEPARPAAPAASGNLLDPGSAAAAKSAMGSLLRTLSSERTAQVNRGGVTIEDLVREEVRPLLKSWLDQHLPPLVERMVRQEIERLTGPTPS